MLRKLLYRLLSLIFIIVIILQLWLYFISLPNWYIKQVQIVNNSYLPDDLITEQLDIPANTSLLKLNSGDLQKRLLTIPQLKKVTVRKKLPGTLVLEVEARLPFLNYIIQNNQWLTDEDGVILNQNMLELTEIEAVPKVVGINTIAGIKESSEQLSSLVLIMNSKILFQEGYVIYYSSKNNLKIILKNKFPVIIGEPAYYKEKINSLEKLMVVLEADFHRIEYIDIKAYSTPAVKFKKGYI